MQQTAVSKWGNWVAGLVPWPRRPDPGVEEIDLGAALRAHGATLDSLDDPWDRPSADPSADPADEALSDSIFQMLTEP